MQPGYQYKEKYKSNAILASRPSLMGRHPPPGSAAHNLFLGRPQAEGPSRLHPHSSAELRCRQALQWTSRHLVSLVTLEALLATWAFLSACAVGLNLQHQIFRRGSQQWVYDVEAAPCVLLPRAAGAVDGCRSRLQQASGAPLRCIVAAASLASQEQLLVDEWRRTCEPCVWGWYLMPKRATSSYLRVMLQVTKEGATLFGSSCPRQCLSSSTHSVPPAGKIIRSAMLLLLIRIQGLLSCRYTSWARTWVYPTSSTCRDCRKRPFVSSFSVAKTMRRGMSSLQVSIGGSGKRASTVKKGASGRPGTSSCAFLLLNMLPIFDLRLCPSKLGRDAN